MSTKTRKDVERLEHMVLSPWATYVDESRGRVLPEHEDEVRTAFQRDRDRILHSKSFRRLSHKTQVFLSPEGDHYRTRLTHTLEVAQIARTCARALGLNEDLTEAIALGHDLGHTPFGHTGEDALTRAMRSVAARHPELGVDPQIRFRHNEQSGRVVMVLEREGRGLNLTYEVVDGIVHHTGDVRPSTPEGRIVAYCDRIAYVNHDIDDALRAGILSEADLPAQEVAKLGHTPSERISSMVGDLISASGERQDVCMSEDIYDAMMRLREFLFKNVYTCSDAKAEEPKANRLVEALFEHFFNNFDEVPREYTQTEGTARLVAVADYIAGMTDRYAVRTFEALNVPRSWAIG